jgi:2-hydroxy-3-oxopropionate reductase
MTTAPQKIGVIGLGFMGTPMAGHLIAADHQLNIPTRSRVPEALAYGSATLCNSPKGVAERAGTVFLMLPDTPDAETVLFGAHGVAAGLSAGKTVVDMSSISPIATKDFAGWIEALGCDHLTHRCRAARSAQETPRCPSWSAATRRSSSACGPC